MKRILLFTIMAVVYISSFAQVKQDPLQEFTQLKKAFVLASRDTKNSKQIKEIINRIDEFLSHVRIERSNNLIHNMMPYLTCSYDNQPFSVSAYLKSEAKVDTITFQCGRWYISNDMIDGVEIDILSPDMVINDKSAKKLMRKIVNKHLFKLDGDLSGKKGSLFFVKEENLYYAAIESKKIPAFLILSNSEVINYASCLKSILKASNIDVTYEEIIRQYMDITIDEQFVPTKNVHGILAGRKIVTTFISNIEYDAATIVNELIKERFMIAIDKDGNIGLLTAIALIGESDYQPTYIRLRMPILSKEDQRVQMSWRDFRNRTIALVKVDIY